MLEHLGSFTQNPFQKFHQNFIKLEKAQKFFKNLGLMCEMHEEWRIKDTYQWRIARSRPKITWEWSLEWERKVSGGEETRSVERDRGGMRKNRAKMYI